MTANAILQACVFFVALVTLALPLGAYIARVYNGEARVVQKILGPLERLFYRLANVKPEEEMSWTSYAAGLLVFNMLGALIVYSLERQQGALPLNPADLSNVSPEVSFVAWIR